MIPLVRNDNYHFTKGKMHNILMVTIDCVTVLKSRRQKSPVNWKKKFNYHYHHHHNHRHYCYYDIHFYLGSNCFKMLFFNFSLD